MKKVQEVLSDRPVSPYLGSEKTAEAVRQAIAEHPELGPEYAATYDPYHSCMSFAAWRRNGYSVKKGAKAIQSYTLIESEDPETGEKQTRRRSINLFHISQTEPIANHKPAWLAKWPWCPSVEPRMSHVYESVIVDWLPLVFR